MGAQTRNWKAYGYDWPAICRWLSWSDLDSRRRFRRRKTISIIVCGGFLILTAEIVWEYLHRLYLFIIRPRIKIERGSRTGSISRCTVQQECPHQDCTELYLPKCPLPRRSALNLDAAFTIPTKNMQEAMRRDVSHPGTYRIFASRGEEHHCTIRLIDNSQTRLLMVLFMSFYEVPGAAESEQF